MSSYAEFFLNSQSSVVQLELLELSHPSFTKTYRIVRNAVNGVLANIEHVYQQFDYYPLRISPTGSRDNLDHSFKLDLGDLGEVLPRELDAIASAGTFDVKPTIRYWTFRSDDLSQPLFGPLILEVQHFNFNKDGCSFEAKAPSLNVSKTGEVYKLDRFPMLRGFL